MKKDTLITTLIVSLVAAYLGMRFGLLAEGYKNLIQGLLAAQEQIAGDLFARPLAFGTSQLALGGAAFGFLGVWMFWAAVLSQPKNERAGQEHGSSRWGTIAEARAFKDTKNPDNNLIFSKNVALKISGNGKYDIEHDRNPNVIVLGGSGAGKTRYVVKPNLMQLYGSYIVNDPKDTCIGETGHLFEDEGYDIEKLDLVNFEQSCVYNPLDFVKEDKEIISFVECLLLNTDGKAKENGDPFWPKAERAFYYALIAYLRDWAPEDDYNLPSVLYLVTMADINEEDPDYKSPLDLLFDEIRTGQHYQITEKNQAAYSEDARGLRPQQTADKWEKSILFNRTTGQMPGESGGIDPFDDYALTQYNIFKSGAGKTLKSIVISAGVRLAVFNIKGLRSILEGRNELQINRLGDPGAKTIIYVNVHPQDKAFHFLASLFVYQASMLLFNRAKDDFGGRLPTHVTFMLDEFATLGYLPGFTEAISVARSFNLSYFLFLQSKAQLEKNYDKEDAKSIDENCDTTLFLGGNKLETNKAISEQIGNATIHTTTSNQSKGDRSSYTKNNQTQSRALLDPAEVGRISRKKAIVLINSTYPFLDDKYPLERHKRYRFIDPGHKGAAYSEPFNFEAYRERRKQEI